MKAKVPNGFVLISRTEKCKSYPGTRKRYFYQCTRTDGFGNTCNFTIRCDKVKDPSKLLHSHQFQLHFPTQREIDLQNNINHFMNLNIKFISRSNISLQYAVSDDFKSYLNELLVFGKSLDNDVDISKILNNLTYYNLRKNLISKAESVRQDRLLEFISFKYGSLAIDGGTINSTYFSDIYLCNPGECIKPLLIYSGSNVSKKSENIKDEVKKALELCKNVKIQSIVGDNFKAQVKTCSNVIRENLTILSFVPCICHLFNLALIDLYNNNEIFHSDINFLRNISKEFNKISRRNNLGILAPEHIPTRWINDIDITYILYIKADILKENFQNQIEVLDFIDKKIPDIMLILLPIRSALQMLEGNSSKICEIIPIVSEIKNFYFDHHDLFIDENYNIIAQDFVNFIESRIQKTSNGHLLQLAYALTPVGRNFIRKSLKEGTYIKDNIEFDIAVNLKFDAKYVKNFLQNINSPWFKSNDMEEEEEEEEKEEEERMEYIQEETVQESISNQKDEQSEIDESEIIDFGIYENCSHYLDSLSSIFSVNPEQLRNEFYCWIYEDINFTFYKDYEKSHGGDSHRISRLWRMLQNNGFPFLGEIARALHAIIASEAVCERGFSTRRSILRKTRSRTKSDLADALLILKQN